MEKSNGGGKMRILILCTGNSCRSQMAHGFLQSFDPALEVFSAGTSPAAQVHPQAVAAMAEVGIDISGHVPHSVQEYRALDWDYVITVCGGAKEHCPVFTAAVKHRVHLGFEDPAQIKAAPQEIAEGFRRVRDRIREVFQDFYRTNIKKQG